ncbi:MAG: DNA-directed RNA polymerase subunit alpha C-terminal domain-containing protein [Kofleriaceae bacterium]
MTIELDEKLFHSVDDLELTVRLANMLQLANINIIGDLASLSAPYMHFKRYKPQSIKEAEVELAKLGFSLGMKIPNWDEERAKRGLAPREIPEELGTVDAIQRTLKCLEKPVKVKKGKAPSAGELAASETQLGVRFPVDYKELVLAFGQLQILAGYRGKEEANGGLRVLKLGELAKAQASLLADWQRWGSDPAALNNAVPVFEFADADEDGTLVWTYRFAQAIVIDADGDVLSYATGAGMTKLDISFAQLATKYIRMFA